MKHPAPQAIINALLDEFDDIEEISEANLIIAKRIILRWAEKHNIFPVKN